MAVYVFDGVKKRTCTIFLTGKLGQCLITNMVKKRFIIRLPFYFGIAILLLLFAKLPGVTALFTPFDCSRCTIGAPLITWLGAGYFAGLLTLIYLAPQFFSRAVASLGILWAIVMGTLLLWLSPAFCYICFFSHLLHVGIWGYFLVYPQHGAPFSAPFFRRLILATQIGLLTTLSYYMIDEGLFKLGGKKTLEAPQFSFTTLSGETLNSNNLAPYRYVVLQFVLPTCQYCKKQLPLLDEIKEKWDDRGIGFFNIVERRKGESDAQLQEELLSYAPHIPIVVDSDFSMGAHFNVRTFPTIIVLNSEGRIVKTYHGTYSKLEAELSALFR